MPFSMLVSLFAFDTEESITWSLRGSELILLVPR